MTSQISKNWIYSTLVFGFIAIILFSALIHQSCPVEKECPTLDYSQCAKTETKIVTNNITKYQCYDDSTKDNLAECSTLEQRLSSNISLSGSGNQVTDKFYLKQGLAIFRNSYHGQSNFMADLIDENGDDIALVANTIGTSETSSSAKIAIPGYYRVDVTAWPGSSWTIKVEQ